MMPNLYEVLRHLVQYGPGRNQAEIDALLGAIAHTEASTAPAEPQEPRPVPAGKVS